jgi:hypothetical protein
VHPRVSEAECQNLGPGAKVFGITRILKSSPFFVQLRTNTAYCDWKFANFEVLNYRLDSGGYNQFVGHLLAAFQKSGGNLTRSR